MNKLKVLGVSASIILATSSFAEKAHVPKQLAGPAEEIELMQKANPEAAAIISKHAMIAVEFNKNKSGDLYWQHDILIDGDNPKVLLFSPNKNNWQLNIQGATQKNGNTDQNVVLSQKETQFGMADEKFPATQFDLQNLSTGRYDFTISAKNKDASNGYLLVSSDSPYQLKSFVSSNRQLVGDVIQVNAQAFANDSEFTMVKNDFELINSSYIRVTAPDGSLKQVSMFDDGISFDKMASDGMFSGVFRAEQEGLYQVQVVSKGITPKGKPFMRTVEHVIPVVASDLVLNSKRVSGEYTADHKINLKLAVGTAKQDSRFRIIAEVWGTQTSGKSKLIPVSWLSTIAEVNQGQIQLQLDDRWLLSQAVAAPYQLKNIRVEELNHYISLLEIESLPLALPQIAALSKASYDGTISESMLLGEKPQSLNVSNKAGGKLMLVHGYCSGDAWGPVQSQFANSVKFTDFNQNRSHDAFAQLIDSYGDNFPSFGVVAHSQGGAAALHLYTYYWSGLDSADSGRLIQSVGTPYQGTPLAGNLALLGEVFGVGCGYNSNLTTSGASSWLSGIPTWARSKVNYYTTSFTTKWWRYDYCNIATDLVLSDPEDGTTEKSRGQLSGAVNRGHKTGQCHTEGMRDMAQTRDSGRNSTMSANAAR